MIGAMKTADGSSEADPLTPREWDVLEFLRKKYSNEDIASELGISIAGVKYHVSEILSKLRLENRTDAASWRRDEGPSQTRAVGPLAMLGRSGLGVVRPISAVLAAALGMVVLAGLLLLVVLLVRSTGDDTGPTLAIDGELAVEEYFEQVQSLFEAYREVGEGPLGDRFESIGWPFDDDETEAFASAVLHDMEPVFEKLADELDDVHPPEEVRVVHESTVVAARKVADTFSDLLGRLDLVASPTEFSILATNEMFGDTGNGLAVEQFVGRCSELQEFADERDFVVDLRCEG